MAEKNLSPEQLKANDDKSVEAVKQALENHRPIAIAFDSNCYVGTGGATVFNQAWQDRLTTLAAKGLKVLVPRVWQSEILRHAEQTVKEISFNSGKQFHPDLKAQVDALRTAVEKLTGRSRESAEASWSDHFQKIGAQLVETPNACLDDVLRRYAVRNPPFEVAGDKKAEFPDAFALKALEYHAEAHGILVVVVATRDGGAIKYCQQSDRLLPISKAITAVDAVTSKDELDRLGVMSAELSDQVSKSPNQLLQPLQMACESMPQWGYSPGMGLYPELGAWQPRTTLDEILNIELLSDSRGNLLRVIADGDPYIQATGRAKFKVLASAIVSARVLATGEAGDFVLFDKREFTFELDYDAMHQKESNFWTVNMRYRTTVIDLPTLPEEWIAWPHA